MTNDKPIKVSVQMRPSDVTKLRDYKEKTGIPQFVVLREALAMWFAKVEKEGV